jgi:hypothetical protein
MITHGTTISFIPLNVEIIKLYLTAGSIDFSLIRNYNQEEIFFFLDLINSNEGCFRCIYSGACERLSNRIGMGNFELMGEDSERLFRRVVHNLEIIYNAKSSVMPDDVRVEFKKALDLLKEAHKFSVSLKNCESNFFLVLVGAFLLYTPTVSTYYIGLLRNLSTIFGWGNF